ncbi:MAG: hypothetical protein AB1782_12210 [Cyanobacteriota bacterium]
MSNLSEDNYIWKEPWYCVDEFGDAFARALHREIGNIKHPLYNIKAKAIARRTDCDDVLFKLYDYEYDFAVVHLTYCTNKETDHNWPAIHLIKNRDKLNDFLEAEHRN